MTRFAKSRHGFTLIELLVVIAIIGILIGLLLPAVQKVREAASRIRCQNNLKQFGIALHNHVNSYDRFPMGLVWNGGPYYTFPRSSWNYHLFPFIEQDGAYRLLGPAAKSKQWMPWWSAEAATPTSPTNAMIKTAICPSDGGVFTNVQGWGYFSLGNYHVLFGGMNLGGATSVSGSQRAAFGVNFGASIGEITDGTSNTMVMTEYLRSTGASNDQRGLWWGDQPGYGHVYTQLSPNSTSPDLIYVGWCVNQPQRNLPCIDGDGGPNNTAAARSMHLGGVNVCMGDGSVRFINQNVDLVSVWRPLATIAGDEALSDF